ncbi:MAG: T9SS type A sorting domain-containing protein [Bacteroidota bacterium]
MNKKFIIVVILALFQVLLNESFAHWTPKLVTIDSAKKHIEKLQYLDNNEAYGTSGGGIIYHTTDNWRTSESITTNIPGNQTIEYMEMYSKTKGIIITKNKMDVVAGSTVYITENGGYFWKTVFIIPEPYSSFRYDISSEEIFVDKFNDKLFVCYADVFYYGNMDGSNWQSRYYGPMRDRYNITFKVINDSIWIVDYLQPEITYNQGNFWEECHGKELTLGNHYQRLENEVILEYDFIEKKWDTLSEKTAMTIQNFRQLSDRYAIVYYYDWRTSQNHYTIFDYQEKKWIDLNSNSNLIDIDRLYHKDNHFVTVDYTGQLLETVDFGQTWQIIPMGTLPNTYSRHQITFNQELQFSVGGEGNRMAYSINKGESWKEIDGTLIKQQLSADAVFPGIKLSYENDAELYLLHDGHAHHLKKNNDSFKLQERLINFASKKHILNISDKGDNSCYLLVADTSGLSQPMARVYKVSTNSTDNIFSTRFEMNSLYLKNPIIQNKDYVVFSIETDVFIYNKTTGVTDTTLINLMNSIEALEFINADELLISSAGDHLTYNINTKQILRPLNNSVFFWLRTAIDNTGKIYVISYFHPFNANGKNFIPDSTFIFNDYLADIRYWNGSLWLAGYYNIYKQEGVLTPKPYNCAQIQNVYPNPMIDVVKVLYKQYSTQSLQLIIYNSIGQVIKTFEISNDTGLYEFEINTSELSTGIYYLNVKTDCGNQTFKVIKVN